MTREEAIRQLDGADIAVLNRDFFKFNQAIIMAISALRQQEHFRDITKKVEPLTNAQKIRSRADEELAEFLWDFNLADVSTVKMGEFGPHMFRYRLKEWLQQPAEDDDHSICGATNLPCIRCNPGGCDNRKEGADNEP